MKVIAQEEWSWTLLEDGERLVLSVLCGGAAMYELDIALSPEERALWETQGAPGLKPLIDAIKARPSDFLSRRVS